MLPIAREAINFANNFAALSFMFVGHQILNNYTKSANERLADCYLQAMAALNVPLKINDNLCNKVQVVNKSELAELLDTHLAATSDFETLEKVKTICIEPMKKVAYFNMVNYGFVMVCAALAANRIYRICQR